MKKFISTLLILVLAADLLNAQGSKVTITTHDGGCHTWRILFADSSTLVVWKSDSSYDADKISEYAARLYPSEINRIIVPRHSCLWAGAGIGLLTGAAVGAFIGYSSGDDPADEFLSMNASEKAELAGIFLGLSGAIFGGTVGAAHGLDDDDFILNGHQERYIAVLPELQENALFQSTPPPELRDFISRSAEPSVQSRRLTSNEMNRLPEPPIPRVHLSVSGAVSITGPAGDNLNAAFNSSGFGGTVNGWLGTAYYPSNYGNPFAWDISSDYDLASNIRLGLRYISDIAERDVEGPDEETEGSRGISYSLLLTYVALPVDSLLSSRSEVALEAGPSFNSLYVGGTLSAEYLSAGFVYTAVLFHERKNVLGYQVCASYDYYFSRHVSLHCMLSGNFIPSSVDVQEVQYTNPSNGETKTLKAHSVNFSELYISTGIRFHF